MSVVTLVVDLQNDFFRHSRLARREESLVSAVNALVTTQREAGSAVVWVRQEFAPDLRDAHLEVRRMSAPVVIQGSSGACPLPGLDISHQDFIVIKKRYSAFFGTLLDDILTNLTCSTLIVAGVNTHACVRTTVVDAYQRDLDVILASDCVDSWDQEHHEISLRYMNGKLGRAMTNSEIEIWMREHRCTPR